MRVATIGGIDLRVDPSWALIIVVLVLTYRATFTEPDRSALAAVVLALVTAVLFCASVLVHELAHALEGSHRGAEVAGITLFVLGGATALRGGDRRARDEFAIAAVGPWSNFVLAAMMGLLATGATQFGLDPVAEVAGVLGWLNLGLAAFNLVPGAPLDGGRVLRAGVWALTGDKHRATVVAAWTGLLLGIALLGLAAWSATGGPGGLWAALWTGAIGAYVLRASILERRRGRVGRWLATRRAGELAPIAATIGRTADAGHANALADGPVRAVLVDDGGPVGLVTAEELEAAPPSTPIQELLRPLDELPRVASDARGDELANLLDREQPFVLVTAREGSQETVGLSSLFAIDQQVQATLQRERER